ncbi:MAG: acetylxylan esterase [Pseudomonadota bacterium]
MMMRPDKTLSLVSRFVIIGAAFIATVQAQDAARPSATSLVTPKNASQSVDARGFIHRWLVLEPIPVPGRLTETAVNEALQAAQVSGPTEALPRDGDPVTANGTTLKWHALDTINYNVNLYHFAWALSKPTSNVLFWITTTVDSPQALEGVRLAIGSNAASRWWLNGEPVIALNDDRQAVIDDGVSRRLTLRKGRNVIRAAVINGGGATDFCARFLDARDQPITSLTVSIQ